MKSIAYLTFATTIFMLIAALAPNFVATVVGLPPGDIGYLLHPRGWASLPALSWFRGSPAVSVVNHWWIGQSSSVGFRCSCLPSVARY
jgi:hypothetical protein